MKSVLLCFCFVLFYDKFDCEVSAIVFLFLFFVFACLFVFCFVCLFAFTGRPFYNHWQIIPVNIGCVYVYVYVCA